MQAGSLMDHLASAIAIPSEEANLVAELQAGSEQAFALLIAQYQQPLYSLIARSLHDPADASDITQEVFIKVFRSIRGFHGEASLRTWLYRIALREAKGSFPEASRLLGIHQKYLHRLVRLLNLKSELH